MASALPSVSDCCSACSGISVTIDDGTAYRQVYSGTGDPNTAVLVPDNVNVANVYYNLAVPGELWNWNIVAQNWF